MTGMREARISYMYVVPGCYGAPHGCMTGRFVIPVRDRKGQVLSIEALRFYIEGFVNYAKNHQRTFFQVNELACYEGEYSPADIAPLFEGVTDNVLLPGTWEPA